MKIRIYLSALFIFVLILGACTNNEETVKLEINSQTKEHERKENLPAPSSEVAGNETSDQQSADPTSEKIVNIDKIMEAQTMNQKAKNPLIWADIPDPDVIRVENYYYMVSTTMHLTPGIPIMRSENLVNWELISYVYDVYEEEDKHKLTNGANIYGKGSWAASLRYHNGIFYVTFASNDMNQTYIYQTDNIETGPWKRVVLQGLYHDPSLLFDEGHVYIVYGNGTIRIKELTEDATAVKENGVSQVLIRTAKDGNIVNSEGSHIYKIDNTYYLFLIEWPGYGTKRRIEWCYRSDTLLGEYEGRTVLDDNFRYENNGVAQGGIVQTPEGDWYAVLFQDHGAVGRIPMIVPVTWEEGWPMMGVDGKVPFELPIELPIEDKKRTDYPIFAEDEFEYSEDRLMLPWQWNHNPDNLLWSVTKRPGFLRLTNGITVNNILEARNTVSQRTFGPVYVGETMLDTSGMKPGDYAGLAAFQNSYGMLGVRVLEDGSKCIMYASNDGTGNPAEQVAIPLEQDIVYLRIDFIFNYGSIKNLMEIDKAYFSYSLDGEKWIKLDLSLSMKYTLDHFMGYRIALYSYATTKEGGYADFDYFHYKDSLEQ